MQELATGRCQRHENEFKKTPRVLFVVEMSGSSVDGAASPLRGSPAWCALKDFETLTLVAEKASSKTRKLYLHW